MLSILSILTLSPAFAAETFDLHTDARAGGRSLTVRVDIQGRREGTETRVVRDDRGILASAAGEDDDYVLTLSATDGETEYAFDVPSACRPYEDGAGCWVDLALLDRDGRATGMNARLMLSSQTAEISTDLYGASVEVDDRGVRTGTAIQLRMKRREAWGDLDAFLRFDDDGDRFDHDRFDGGDDTPPPPTPDGRRGTWRVLTYNVGGLPQTAFSDDEFTPDEDDFFRGTEIAEKILLEDYDVIAFNEVMNDSMREALYTSLVGTYPYVLEEAWNGSDGVSHTQDSGLMLFSRFEGAAVDLGVECNADADIIVTKLDGGDGGQVCNVSFFPYTDLDGRDTFEDKGFYWVHLDNPITGRPVSIIGTHAQATYFAEDTKGFNDERAVRDAALKELMDVVDLVRSADEDLLLLGDLNIIGDQTEPTDEYMMSLSTVGTVRFHGLEDEWRQTTSKEDPGYSWDGSTGLTGNMVANNSAPLQERLDYVLGLREDEHDGKYQQLCYQHMQLRRDFDGTYGDLSDHYGLDTVIGWESERCDPMRAQTNIVDNWVAGDIDYGGAYQWYYVDEPGTYTMRLDSAIDLHVVAYASDDLSTPLTWFEGDGKVPSGELRTTSVLDATGPFYLRVSAESATDVGSFQLRVGQNRGSSWTDYLVLHNGVPESGSFYETVGSATYQDALYFRFRQKALWSTAAGNQMHRFDAETCDGATCAPIWSTVYDVTHHARHYGATDIDSLTEQGDTWLVNDNADYYFVLHRSYELVERPVTVTWATDARTVRLKDLTCLIQEDYYGDDDIYADVTVDGMGVAPLLYDFIYGQMDTNGSVKHPFVTGMIDPESITFHDGIQMSLYEIDDIDAHDWLGTDTIIGGGLDEAPFTKSDMPPSIADDVVYDQHDLKFHEDDAAYRLVWNVLD